MPKLFATFLLLSVVISARTSLLKCVSSLFVIGDRSGNPRRGTLAELGRSFGGVGSSGMAAGTNRRASRQNDATDFMSKVRKRRESSADITIFRKGSGSGAGISGVGSGRHEDRVSDLKSDISK